VKKIILEILVLMWKALKLVLWKWLRPMMGRILMYAAVLIGLIVLLVMIFTRM
jgi:hypothetical protein